MTEAPWKIFGIAEISTAANVRKRQSEMADELEDVFDYPMSENFVSETRRIPYRRGFRLRRHSPRTIEDLLALPDRDFDKWVRNLCRLPYGKPEQSPSALNLQHQIDNLQTTIRQLQGQLQTLMQSSAAKVPAGSLSGRKGLDVEPRA